MSAPGVVAGDRPFTPRGGYTNFLQNRPVQVIGRPVNINQTPGIRKGMMGAGSSPGMMSAPVDPVVLGGIGTTALLTGLPPGFKPPTLPTMPGIAIGTFGVGSGPMMPGYGAPLPNPSLMPDFKFPLEGMPIKPVSGFVKPPTNTGTFPKTTIPLLDANAILQDLHYVTGNSSFHWSQPRLSNIK